MAEAARREERGCVFCGVMTRELYSLDLDLPGVPFCNRVCARRRELRAEKKAESA